MDAPLISPEFEALQRAVAGRYSLERELGRGGMGVVFLAKDVALERPVAIKLLPPTLAFDPDLRQRFLREARTAAGLSHPHIVPIHLVEQHDDLVYFVMGYVEGESLGQRVRRRGPLRTPEVMRIVREVAWALGYAHGRGVIHRDIKPDNIMIEKGSSRAVVMDFGIARVVDAPAGTARGELIGTVHYMSPEQAAGDPVDGRSDLWSLGVTAFFALTGTLPFEGPTLPATIAQIVTGEKPALQSRASGVPAASAVVVERLLARDADARFATAEALVESLDALVRQEPPPPPEIRHFFRTMRGLELSFGLLLMAVVIGSELIDVLWVEHFDTLLMIAAMVGVQVLTPVVLLSIAGRRLLQAGYSFDDVRRVATRDHRDALEESLVGATPSDVLSRMRRWRYVGGALLGGGVLGLLSGLGREGGGIGGSGWMGEVAGWGLVSSVIGGILLAGSIFVPWVLTGARRSIERRQRSIPLMARSLGRWLFRLLGWGLPSRTVSSVPSDAPTEVALRQAVGSLVADLPQALRRRFSDIPALAQRLEAGVRRLHEVARRRVEVGIDGAPAMERGAGAIVALENLRLDLMRLRAGTATAEDLTADLEQVRAVSEAVDAELAGMEEVSRILKQ